MKIRLLLVAVAAILIFTNCSTLHQGESDDPLVPKETSSAIYLGPVAGYNRSMHSVTLASFAPPAQGENLCPTFDNGSSNGFHFGLFYEQFFGPKTGSKHSVVARVLYNSFPASFTTIGDKYKSLVPTTNSDGTVTYNIVESTTEHDLSVSYSTLSVDLMYKFNVVGRVVLTAGPTFDFPLTKKLTQTYKLLTPLDASFKPVPGVVYEQNGRVIDVYNGDISAGKGGNVASFRLGMKFGVQYEIITGSIVDFIPGLFYNLALTNAADAQSWKVNAIQASVDVRFAIK